MARVAAGDYVRSKKCFMTRNSIWNTLSRHHPSLSPSWPNANHPRTHQIFIFATCDKKFECNFQGKIERTFMSEAAGERRVMADGRLNFYLNARLLLFFMISYFRGKSLCLLEIIFSTISKSLSRKFFRLSYRSKHRSCFPSKSKFNPFFWFSFNSSN